MRATALFVAIAMIGTAAAVPGVSIVGTEAGTAYDLSNVAGYKIGYIDSASTGVFGSLDAGEAVLLDVDGDSIVDSGEVVLRAGATPYTTVGSFTTATGHTLTPTTGGTALTTLLLFEDTAPAYSAGGPDGKFGPGDKLFIDVNKDGLVSENDIQLHKISGTFGANYAASASNDAFFDRSNEKLCINQGGGDVPIIGADCVGVTISVTNAKYLDNGATPGSWDAGELVFFGDAAPTTVVSGLVDVVTTPVLATPELTFISCHTDQLDANCGAALVAGTFKISSKPKAPANLKLVTSTNEFVNTANSKSYYFIDSAAVPVIASAGMLALDSTNTPGDWTTVGAQFPVLLTAFAAPPKVMITSDVNAVVDGDEVVALDLNGDSIISHGDFILADKATGTQTSCTALTQLTSTTTCATAAWTDMPLANFAFSTIDGNNEHGQGDAVYLLLDATGNTADTWDVRIVRNDAFAVARVSVSDTDNGNGMFAAGLATVKYYDRDGTGTYTAGDGLYLDMQNDGRAGPYDIRLFAGATSGNLVATGDLDAQHILRDSNGDGGLLHQYNDGIRTIAFRAVSTGAGVVVPGDVRFIPWASGQTAGTVLLNGDPDFAYGTTGASAAVLCYLDANGNSVYDAKDTVYASVGAACGNIKNYDTLVNLLGVGKLGVQVGTQANGAGAALPGTFDVSYLDENANAAYGFNEKVYLDVDGNGLLGPGDILLKDTGGIATPTSTSSTAAPPPAATTSSSSTTTSSSSSTTSSSSSSSSTSSSSTSSSTSSSQQTSDSSSQSSSESSQGSSSEPSPESDNVRTPPLSIVMVLGLLGVAVAARRK